MKRYVRAEYIPDMTERYPEGMREMSRHSDEYDAYDDFYATNKQPDEEPTWNEWDPFKGKKYAVVGSRSNYPGEVSESSEPVLTDRPDMAIVSWFQINEQFPMDTFISTQTKQNARELIRYAVNHMDWVMSLFDEYKCHYKPDYFKNALLKKFDDGCKYFHESEFGDLIYPFDIG